MSDTAKELPSEGYVRLPVILRVYPVSKSAWYAGIKAGIYPEPKKLGKRTSAWPVQKIRDLIASVGGE